MPEDFDRTLTRPPAPPAASDDAMAPVLAKLQRISALEPADIEAIRALPRRVEVLMSGDYIVRTGDLVSHCCFLLDGHAFRSKLTGDGSRQIVSFHILGDVVDLQHVELNRADHNVQVLDQAVVAWVPIEPIRRLMTDCVAIGRALWRDSLIDASIFREWVLNVGRRNARSRVAHLLCEFIYRRQAVLAGQQQPQRFDLPMTQEQLADATGLTSVHVNRTLQHLAASGLIRRDRRSFEVLDWKALQNQADFDPAYLHLS